ncbi:hypothetical protein PUN4_230152 [Paraburkholderia unamae]|nr:hypothetical protein PUN4_230152 [Paraburkholderia unamae]
MESLRARSSSICATSIRRTLVPGLPAYPTSRSTMPPSTISLARISSRCSLITLREPRGSSIYRSSYFLPRRAQIATHGLLARVGIGVLAIASHREYLGKPGQQCFAYPFVALVPQHRRIFQRHGIAAYAQNIGRWLKSRTATSSPRSSPPFESIFGAFQIRTARTSAPFLP